MTVRPIALVAEDDAVLRMLTADMLEECGFEVMQAADAVEALRELAGQPATALLMTDVQMPGEMDGFGLARAAAILLPALAIIVCSGQARPQPSDMPTGAQFIGKPFTFESVGFALRQLKVA